MRSRKLRSLRWAVALALVTCTGLVPTTEATGATFTIEGIFGDSTAFSGELEIDLATGELSSWRIQTLEGQLSVFEWTPANSQASYLDAIDDARLLYFRAPPPPFSNKLIGRELEIFLTDRIERSAALAMLPLQSEEREPCPVTFCLDLPAARSVVSLELAQVPEPGLGCLLLAGMASLARIRTHPHREEPDEPAKARGGTAISGR